MAKLMLTIQLKPAEVNLAHVRQKLNLSAGEIDEDFGVISVDSASDLYTVLVEEKAVSKVLNVEGVKGPYSNPRIETFGPPQL